MKRAAFILLSLSINLIVTQNALTQVIDFKSVRIDQGMEMARAQNKNLFILIGATHCRYSYKTFSKLLQNKACGEYFNEHFISISYGDTIATEAIKWFNSQRRMDLHQLELELEAVLSYYFFVPGYIFFNEKMEMVYFNEKMKRPRRILKYAKWVEDDKVKLPFRFHQKDNHDMHPKNENTYPMLTHCLKAYLLMDVPENIDYRVPDKYNIEDFSFKKDQLKKAKAKIEKSLEYDEYYFNCFLASLIYHKSGNADIAIKYAKKGLNNYPNYEWMASKRLTDRLMEEILNINGAVVDN